MGLSGLLLLAPLPPAAVDFPPHAAMRMVQVPDVRRNTLMAQLPLGTRSADTLHILDPLLRMAARR